MHKRYAWADLLRQKKKKLSVLRGHVHYTYIAKAILGISLIWDLNSLILDLVKRSQDEGHSGEFGLISKEILEKIWGIC